MLLIGVIWRLGVTGLLTPRAAVEMVGGTAVPAAAAPLAPRPGRPPPREDADVRLCVSPRTALVGALISAGVAAGMLTAATAYAPPPQPSAAATVRLVPHGPATTAER
jgi:hypothetical protein